MQQSKLLETVLPKSVEGNSSANSFTLGAVSNSIGKFTYNPDEGISFEYIRRSGEIFRNECKTWTDEKKDRILLRKWSPAEHEKYCNYILPKIQGNINFDETVLNLRTFVKKNLYSIRNTSVETLWKRWTMIAIYAGIINMECDISNLNELIANNFRCLKFVKE